MTNRFPLVLVPPSTALVNAWKNTQVPVGLLLLAALARRQPGVLPRVHLGPMHFPDRAAADAATRTEHPANTPLRDPAGRPTEPSLGTRPLTITRLPKRSCS